MNAHSVVDDRALLMQDWLLGVFPTVPFSIHPLAGDASFRRYFRVRLPGHQLVLMDAPPEKESCDAFVAVTQAFSDSMARFPKIIASDLSKGFLLLTDFGDRQLQMLLSNDTVDSLYQKAMDSLLHIQQCKAVEHYDLPYFSDALYWREFEIFDTWYIQKNLNKTLSVEDNKKLKKTYQSLIDSFAEQPKVFVHRDYHSRNIMLCEDDVLGILDYQDAVWGTITYDLVSLLKDCYVAWSDDQITRWVAYFFEALKKQRDDIHCDFETFLRWFDFAGLQRHLKCLGIFSRLHFRDHKNGYLKEIPRVQNYVMRVCDRYPEWELFKQVIAS